MVLEPESVSMQCVNTVCALPYCSSWLNFGFALPYFVSKLFSAEILAEDGGVLYIFLGHSVLLRSIVPSGWKRNAVTLCYQMMGVA